MVRDFPGGPVIKNSPSNAGGVGSIPGTSAMTPHAWWPKKLKYIFLKKKQYCNKFSKDFKNGSHQKILKKKNLIGQIIMK